jgi:hypothetical protein
LKKEGVAVQPQRLCVLLLGLLIGAGLTGCADNMPSFRFSSEGKLGEPPSPSVPFAVVCRNVTDAGLGKFAKLKRLRTLCLFDAQVTDAGLRELKEALPKCNIFRR